LLVTLKTALFFEPFYVASQLRFNLLQQNKLITATSKARKQLIKPLLLVVPSYQAMFDFFIRQTNVYAYIAGSKLADAIIISNGRLAIRSIRLSELREFIYHRDSNRPSLAQTNLHHYRAYPKFARIKNENAGQQVIDKVGFERVTLCRCFWQFLASSELVFTLRMDAKMPLENKNRVQFTQ